MRQIGVKCFVLVCVVLTMGASLATESAKQAMLRADQPKTWVGHPHKDIYWLLEKEAAKKKTTYSYSEILIGDLTLVFVSEMPIAPKHKSRFFEARYGYLTKGDERMIVAVVDVSIGRERLVWREKCRTQNLDSVIAVSNAVSNADGIADPCIDSLWKAWKVDKDKKSFMPISIEQVSCDVECGED